MYCVADFQLHVLLKLDEIIENQREGLTLLRRLVAAACKAREGDEDMVPHPLDTTDDLANLCERLKDDGIRKNMVNSLENIYGQITSYSLYT